MVAQSVLGLYATVLGCMFDVGWAIAFGQIINWAIVAFILGGGKRGAT